ncbi:MAG: lysophospholipase, partial [Lachnospiraceae bacterium]|nr:lysophospholipase [Lachnospiraceae bacterium]
MKLLCYGDSNTYGYDPRLCDDDRLPKEERWTGILDLLPEYQVVNQGQNGREIPTMEYEYDFFRKVLQYHRDCQVLTIMLGTNDLYHI